VLGVRHSEASALLHGKFHFKMFRQELVELQGRQNIRQQYLGPRNWELARHF